MRRGLGSKEFITMVFDIPVSAGGDEVDALVEYIQAQGGVDTLLEVGSLYGYNFDRLVRAFTPLRAVSLDYPGKSGGEKSARPILRAVVDRLVIDGFNASLVIGDSADPITVQLVNGMGPFDLVFVDGDHSYDAVRRDHRNYPAGRFQAFHDISNASFGVHRWWQEVKASPWTTHEFRFHDHPGSKRHLGVGVIQAR